MEFRSEDITSVQADIIVNASNGIGYMGGWIGRLIQCKGVAESIHYATRGCVEKEAKLAAKKTRWLPRYLYGHRAGEIFVTGAANLPASWIIHAVTMPYPGMSTRLTIVEQLLPKIIGKAIELNAGSIALPLLGTGTGRLRKQEVINLYEQTLMDINELKIIVVSL